MNKEKLVPKLRFKEFSSNWNVSKLKEITSYVDYRGRSPIKSESGHFLVTAKNIKQGFIDYECSKEYVAEKDYSTVMSKGLPKLGDVLFTTEAPMGNVSQVDISDIALAQRVIKFRGNEKLKNIFLLHYMLSKPFKKYISRKAIGSTVQGISGKELHKTPIYFPKLEEQQKIATFLAAVDKKIALLQQKKSLLEHYKKGVMQQIFSQQLRFKDDDGNEFADWEEKRLGEVAVFSKGKGISKNDILEEGSIECIRYGELYTHYGEIISIVISKTNLSSSDLVLSKENDVIIPSSGESHIDIATASCVLKEGIALGGDLNIIRSNFNGIFLSYYLNNAKKNDIARLSQGTSVVHLYSSQLSKLKVMQPSIEEQTKIANFLSTIDTKITLVNTQLQNTQQFKKGLLQQLFV